jgi:amidase
MMNNSSFFLSSLSWLSRLAQPLSMEQSFPITKRLSSPDGWNWDYGTTRGFPNESEYTYVKVDFYNNIKTYLSELNNTSIRSLEDIVQYNIDNDGTEGGNPWPLGIPAFYSGQDGFLASLETKGIMDDTYFQALSFCQQSTREGGIDAALNYNGKQLSGLLVPPDVAQTYQIAAQAGYPMLTLPAGTHSSTGMPFGLAIMQTCVGGGRAGKVGKRYRGSADCIRYTTSKDAAEVVRILGEEHTSI